MSAPFSFSAGRISRRHSFQIVKRINPRCVSVRPNRLNSIAAHADKPNQLKGRRCQRPVGILIDIPQNVRFTLAIRARATAPQPFQWNKTLTAIIPFDGQFLADLLKIQRSHQRIFRRRSKAARVSGLTWCSIPSASISDTFPEIPSERKKATTVSCRRLHSRASRCPASVRKMDR